MVRAIDDELTAATHALAAHREQPAVPLLLQLSAMLHAQVAALMDDPAELDRQMAAGAARAREVAAATLADVYANLGFVTGR